MFTTGTRKPLFFCQIVGIFGLVSLTSASALAASGPLPFDQWTVSNGIIDNSAACAASGVSCTVLAQDNGFLQQQVTTAAGSFVHMILTDPDATGTPATLGFTTENFIPDNNLTGFDIVNRQVIRDIPQGFEQVANIDRTPFLDSAGDVVDLAHVELTQTMATPDFDTRFKLLQHEALLPNGDSHFGKSVDINQTMVAANDSGNQPLKQVFDSRERLGSQLTNVNNTLQIDPFTPAGSLHLNNETVSWNTGDHVKSIWMAQNNSVLLNPGFAYQQFDNISQGIIGTKELSMQSNEVIDPFSWDQTTFGQAPSVP